MASLQDVQKLRNRLDHPVIDCDGHLIESWPLFFRYLAKIGGSDLQECFLREMRERPIMSIANAATGDPKMSWWGMPTDTRDLATVMLPKLLHERADELGMDFLIMYPTLGLVLPTLQDEKVRRGAVRALNTMNYDVTAPYASRLTAAAVIPMHSPEEAVDEIEYVTQKLSMRVAVIEVGVARPLPAFASAFPGAFRMDCYGIDSAHDYSPVWEAFQKHKLALTVHGSPSHRYLPTPRRSSTNYMYNHIFGFAPQQVDLCLSLILGGVPQRFPKLNIAFLEGGVGWACDVVHLMHEHFEKRNINNIRMFDPKRVDKKMLEALCAEYGAVGEDAHAIRPNPDDFMPKVSESDIDEFAQSGLKEDSDIARIFGERFFFGCEADDRSIYRGMDAKANAYRLRLRPCFSSDIGHWDAVEMSKLLLSSHKLVDQGLLTDADYRDFVFTYPARLHLEMNPNFFEGTRIESAAKDLLRSFREAPSPAPATSPE